MNYQEFIYHRYVLNVFIKNRGTYPCLTVIAICHAIHGVRNSANTAATLYVRIADLCLCNMARTEDQRVNNGGKTGGNMNFLEPLLSR